MNIEPLHGVKGCIFDAYGTLFDFASATRACEDVLGDKLAPLTNLWRDKQLQYTWLLAAQERHRDFYQVTADALDFSLETLNVSSPGLREKLLNLYLFLSPFPEVEGVLKHLKGAGLKLAILSNGTQAMLDSAVRHAELEGYFDAVLSVEAVGVFKPSPRVYQYALDRLDMPVGAVTFQSSNGWDAHAASAFGMKTIWCNRYGQRRERLPGSPDREITTLSAMPSLVVGSEAPTG
ncbi:haloacid dehalogenase type II [Bosea psychrotolerans]|uniref:(S)-2-haloacid dehalogenase n=1 Tax=Bosea psychrotolerans TaxID=1871628 RepID=A0A2S4M7S9_9HYPH|nr:haloacid dehalogenase type II [Bosea psychrotolerans]POR50790.1 2-haloacid dehalogenase [Bosea psychrotolerans]